MLRLLAIVVMRRGMSHWGWWISGSWHVLIPFSFCSSYLILRSWNGHQHCWSVLKWPSTVKQLTCSRYKEAHSLSFWYPIIYCRAFPHANIWPDLWDHHMWESSAITLLRNLRVRPVQVSIGGGLSLCIQLSWLLPPSCIGWKPYTFN